LLRKKIIVLFKIAFCSALLLPFILMPSSSAKRSVPILLYHSISDEITGIDQLFVSPSQFYKQIKYLTDTGYTPLSFNELQDYKNYKKPILITFDDGYRDNYFSAYPILKKFNFKATIFLITCYINKPGYLTESQIREMSDIISFQSHTINHSELDTLYGEALIAECTKPKEIIEAITKKPVDVFSYPFGRYNNNVLEIVSMHYKYAVTTKRGVYDNTVSRYEINRLVITRSYKMSDFVRTLFGVP
jgi:peptidoglycan/xylan/chitin deacetylase (PgdA/CDA1 family)